MPIAVVMAASSRSLTDREPEGLSAVTKAAATLSGHLYRHAQGVLPEVRQVGSQKPPMPSLEASAAASTCGARGTKWAIGIGVVPN